MELLKCKKKTLTSVLFYFSKHNELPFRISSRLYAVPVVVETVVEVPVPPTTPGTVATKAPPTAKTPSPATPTTGGFPNVAAAAIATPELSTLVEIATAAGLADALSDEKLVATLLAPTNAAFTALLSKLGVTVDQLLANPDLVTTVLSYHLIPGVAAKAADLTHNQVLPTSDDGQTLTVLKSGSTVEFKPSAPNAPNAKVVKADIPAGSAIVHIVDQVLIPANIPAITGAATTTTTTPPSPKSASPPPSPKVASPPPKAATKAASPSPKTP